jgi:site-specific recombinase XerD
MTAERADLHGEMVNAWLEAQSSPHTRQAYRLDVQTFGRWCAQQGVVTRNVDEAVVVAFWRAREAAGDSASTLRRRLSSLSSFYEYWRLTDTRRTNPVSGATRPEPTGRLPGPAVLSRGAIEQHLANAALVDRRLEALVSLMVLDGLKLVEVLDLDVDDVSGRLPTLSVIVRRRDETKVRLDARTAQAVAVCAARRRGQPLLVSARPAAVETAPQRLTRFGADHLMRQLTGSGSPRVTTNDLRRFHLFTVDSRSG